MLYYFINKLVIVFACRLKTPINRQAFARIVKKHLLIPVGMKLEN